jgi:hypothetical protein
VHRVGGGAGVDHGAALRLGRGDGEEAGAQAVVEVAPLLLETVVAAALGGAGETLRHREVEDEREVGPERAGDEAIERVEVGARDAAGAALVGDGGIGVAVGDDPAAGVERRPDGADEMIAPRRGDEQRLGERVPAPRRTADEELAQLLGARRAARLAGRDRRDPGAVQRLDEAPDLGRLAGAFAAFKGDEAPPQRFAPKMR